MALPSIMLLVSSTNSKPWTYGAMLCDHWGGVAGAGFDHPALLHDDMWSFDFMSWIYCIAVLYQSHSVIQWGGA